MSQIATNENDYYAQILDRFQKVNNQKNLDIFISREIIKVLREPKQTVTSDIVKNSIILLLALFRQDHQEPFRSYNEFNESERTTIQQELLPLIVV